MSREEVLNFLMNSDKLYQEEKKKLKSNNSKKEIGKNYKLYDPNDPEYTQDFNMAYLKVLNNMMKNSSKVENPEILKILTSDATDLSMLTSNQRERITDKIEKYLEKKTKKLEVN